MRIFSVLLLFLSFFSGLAEAQTDSSIFRAPDDPVEQCEKQTRAILQKMIGLHISDRDSLVKLMAQWEGSCGAGEAIYRLDLLLAVHQKSLTDVALERYYAQYLSKFYDRRQFARFPEADTYYTKHKGYWEFIPLDSDFDIWTRRLATYLLDSQEVGSDGRLICLLFANETAAFGARRSEYAYAGTATSQYFKDTYGLIYPWEIEGAVTFGSRFPGGLMAEVYHPSPYLDFLISIPVKNELRFEINTSFTALQQKKPVFIQTIDTLIGAKTRLGWQLSLGVKQSFPLSPKTRFDVSGGLGYSYVGTNQRKPTEDPEYEVVHYGLHAIDLSAGAGFRWMLNKRKSIGLVYSYHYVPYGFNKILITPIGNGFGMLGLSYRF